MSVDFKPSQINPFAKPIEGTRDVRVSHIPFLATFSKVESEVFAALMHGAMVDRGDEWQAVEPRAVGLWLKERLADEKDTTWVSLMFCKPHPHHLIENGWCRFVGEAPENQGRPIEFTELGLEALRCWVKP